MQQGNRGRRTILIALTVLFTYADIVPAAVYYVDIEHGNDRISGNKKHHAWETLNKVKGY